VFDDPESEKLRTRVNELTQAVEARESMLRANERHVALGRMMAGFTHELNTPVSIARSALTLLNDRVSRLCVLFAQDEVTAEELDPLVTELRKAAEVSLANIARLEGLVASMKRVSTGAAAPADEPFRMADMLRDLEVSLEPLMKQSSTRLEVHAGDDLQMAGVRAGLLQVLTNLVVNAVNHAYPPGRAFDAKRIVVRARREGDDCVLEVQDFGAGIDAAFLPRIYQPFETTARERGGTGLGLAICKEIATEMLHGSISCESTPGQGTLFSVRFPIAQSRR
jgi:two-component system NtrC family sensor kinase